jgi:histone-lysine N-methyltransferase SETMAR
MTKTASMSVDVAEGQERVPVLLEVGPAAAAAYSELHHRFQYHARLPIADVFAPHSGCRCTGACAVDCPCLQYGSFYAGELLDLAALERESILQECSDLCSCSASCQSRLTQRGIKAQLQLRFTSPKGFALHALCDIPAGRYICSYVGEIISTSEAQKRWQRLEAAKQSNYILVLREHLKDSTLKTCIDPATQGNIGRFLNHSCEPNLGVFVVRRVGHLVPGWSTNYAAIAAHTRTRCSSLRSEAYCSRRRALLLVWK